MFVSTIEPRKGHATLLDAWQRLLVRNVPQQHGFRLVFVGRPGWMVVEVLCRLEPPPWGVLHLSGCSDQVLASLYRHAAFCCYPSQYEGYGLPLIEAFARGKPVLSSTGGALPETAGRFAPSLDPGDIDAWTAMLWDWIGHPSLVAARARGSPITSAIPIGRKRRQPYSTFYRGRMRPPAISAYRRAAHTAVGD